MRVTHLKCVLCYDAHPTAAGHVPRCTMALPFNVNKRKWPRVTHRARHEMPATPPVQAPSPEHSAAARCKATRTTMYPPTLGPDEVSPLPKPPPRKPTGKYGIAPWTLETEEDAKAAVQAVASSARAWHELPSAAKIAILQEMHSNTIKATIALGEAIAKVLVTAYLAALWWHLNAHAHW